MNGLIDLFHAQGIRDIDFSKMYYYQSTDYNDITLLCYANRIYMLDTERQELYNFAMLPYGESVKFIQKVGKLSLALFGSSGVVYFIYQGFLDINRIKYIKAEFIHNEKNVCSKYICEILSREYGPNNSIGWDLLYKYVPSKWNGCKHIFPVGLFSDSELLNPEEACRLCIALGMKSNSDLNIDSLIKFLYMNVCESDDRSKSYLQACLVDYSYSPYWGEIYNQILSTLDSLYEMSKSLVESNDYDDYDDNDDCEDTVTRSSSVCEDVWCIY